MEVRGCRRCRRLFNYLGGPSICPTCKEELEKIFYKVKEYIRENPQANMREVALENEVDLKQIQQWVREERLQFSEDSDIAIQCESCGKRILTGRYCDECKSGMANRLNKAFQADKKPQEHAKKPGGNAMRFIKK